MVVLDTDFFSSLFKIGKLKLVLKLFNTDKVIISSTTYEELKNAPFFNKAIHIFAFSKQEISEEKFILVKEVNLKNIQKYFDSRDMAVLGKGEQGSILLGKKTNDVILIDDKKARDIAKQENLRVISLPSFLVGCKRKDIISKEEITQIIGTLKEKDNYEFSKEVKKILLA